VAEAVSVVPAAVVALPAQIISVTAVACCPCVAGLLHQGRGEAACFRPWKENVTSIGFVTLDLLRKSHRAKPQLRANCNASRGDKAEAERFRRAR